MPANHAPRQLLTCYFACLALLLAAWLPMPANSSGASWVELCTAQGYQRVALDGTAPLSDSLPCLWCSLHCSLASLPHSKLGLGLSLFIAQHPPRPAMSRAPDQQASHWPVPLSRAPPHLSA